MDLKKLIAQKLAERATLEKRRADAKAEGDRIVADAEAASRNLTEAEEARIGELIKQRKDDQTAIGALDAKVAEYRAAADEDDAAQDLQTKREPGAERPKGGARVVKEPRTYMREKSANGEASFFADTYRAVERGDVQARERLQRHQVEMEREGELTERAMTSTGFAGLVVPQYLVDDVALLVRSGRPFANSIAHRPLPTQGMSFVIPRGTTGAAAASQATENTSVQNTDEVWANLTIPVNTIAGQQDVSRQSLERGTPGIDELVYMDLAGAYHAEVDRQTLAGTGSNNQMLGVQNTASINAATAYGAAIDFGKFNTKVAGQIAAVAGAGVGIDPRLIAMHPRRWGWMNTLVDSAGRPLIVPNANGPFNAAGVNVIPGGTGAEGDDPTATTGYNTVGSIQGLPILTDANVPTAVGTASEDLVFVYDPTKLILWEDGDGMPRQLRFEQTLGNQLTVKIVAYGYAAFTAGRYPQAVGKIGGLDTASNGQIAPLF